VHVLVASVNVALFDEIITRHARSAATRVARLHYVMYDSPSDLREHVERAQLVISDLPNVEQWARSAGVRVLSPGEFLDAPADRTIAPVDVALGQPAVRAPTSPPWGATSAPRVDTPLRLG
jgi:hypothetical protein